MAGLLSVLCFLFLGFLNLLIQVFRWLFGFSLLKVARVAWLLVLSLMVQPALSQWASADAPIEASELAKEVANSRAKASAKSAVPAPETPPCTSQPEAPNPCDDGTPTTPKPPTTSGPDGPTCEAPVSVTGEVTVTKYDIAIPQLRRFSNLLSYNSLLLDASGSPIDISGSGFGWMASSFGPYIRFSCDNGNDIEVYISASDKRTFKKVGNDWVAPAGCNVTLIKSNSGVNELYTYTDLTTGAMAVFYGMNPSVSGELHGRLKERKNQSFDGISKTGTEYSYVASGAARGKVDRATTSEGWEVDYSYKANGRLEKVEAYDGSVAAGTLIQKSEYTYYEDVIPNHTALGSDGDLVQVKTSRKLSDGNWDESVSQYRYFRHGGSDAGEEHQLKLVLENDAIERIIHAEASLNHPDDILDEADSVVEDYASQSFEYYTSNLNTGANVTTPWGSENLQTKYGGSNLNEFANSTGLVKTSTSGGAGCGSCGGGSGNGITKTYFYMKLNGGSSADLNEVTQITVEDTEDSDGNEVSRKLYGLNDQGTTLRTALIENPTVGGTNIKAWCTSQKLNSDRKMTESRSPSAHTDVNSDALLKKFLDPTTSNNDSDTLNDNDGVIRLYEYNSDGYRTGTRIKLGEDPSNLRDDYYLSATDWSDKGLGGVKHFLPTARYVYREATTTRSSGIKTTYAYTFWAGTNNSIVKKRTITQPIDR